MNPILEQRLEKLKSQGLYRSLQILPEAGGKFLSEGRQILNFSSNDYLNLSTHPQVRAAALEAIGKVGSGAPSSRLMSGHLQEHEQLEHSLAKLMETETALVFGSGFLGNLGVITALLTRSDYVFSDKLCHASLIDGIRLSGANSYRFKHNDLADLETLLQQHSSPDHLNLIISESVFSMDGDLAPIADLVALGRRYHALIMIDEAHALGVFGHHGGALSTDLPRISRPDIVMATLGKSLGSYGGFCAVSAEVRDYFINTARSFIFSTALPPGTIASANSAVEILLQNPNLGSELRRRTQFFCNELRSQGVKVEISPSSIIPIMIGDNVAAVTLAKDLRKEGLLITAIRPPTVPVGTARLRLSVSLAHEEADLSYAAKVIGQYYSRYQRD